MFTLQTFTDTFFPQFEDEPVEETTGDKLQYIVDDPISLKALENVGTVVFTSVSGSYTKSFLKSLWYSNNNANSAVSFEPRDIKNREYDIYKGLGHDQKDLLLIGVGQSSGWFTLSAILDVVSEMTQIFCMMSIEHFDDNDANPPIMQKNRYTKIFVDVYNPKELKNKNFRKGFTASTAIWESLSSKDDFLIDKTMDLLLKEETDIINKKDTTRDSQYVTGLYAGVACHFKIWTNNYILSPRSLLEVSTSIGVLPDDACHPSARDPHTGEFRDDQTLLAYTPMTFDRFSTYLMILDSYKNMLLRSRPVFVFTPDFWKMTNVITQMKLFNPITRFPEKVYVHDTFEDCLCGADVEWECVCDCDCGWPGHSDGLNSPDLC